MIRDERQTERWGRTHLDVEVVEHCAAVYAGVQVVVVVQLLMVAVDYLVAAVRLLVTSSVTLVLATIVDERVLLVRQVLHCSVKQTDICITPHNKARFPLPELTTRVNGPS